MDDAARIALVQKGFAEIASVLSLVANLLNILKTYLPVSETEDAELEGDIPYTVATDLGGTIECVNDDHIAPAVRMLLESAQTNPEELRRKWVERGAGGGAGST